jgi:hypothetical protein
VSRRRSEEARRGEIAAEMACIGPVVPGSLIERSMRCRNTNCRCHSDPPHLHGPYWFWTRKVKAKTVSKVLSAEQAAEYRTWFDNERRLRALVKELEALGVAAIEADPRSPRRGGAEPDEPVDEA